VVPLYRDLVANEHQQRLSRVAVLDSVILAVACLVTFMLVTDAVPRIYHLSHADDLIGGRAGGSAGAVRLTCRPRATGTESCPAPARPQPRRWSIAVARGRVAKVSGVVHLE
jgi:hypothetical protein